MIRLALLLAIAGCIHDHYECGNDGDCDLGVAGRCELDRHCTALDATCEMGRRYTAHAGTESDQCWPGTVSIGNLCAAGQPPATAEGCAATVCSALPACCRTGWTDACVLEAQRSCPIACDTRIAITATKPGKTELWDLQWHGTTWSATSHTERETLLAYLAPAPNTIEPRLAGFTAADTLFSVGEQPEQTDYPVSADHRYQDVSSVDFDRDLRDTVVLSSQDAANAANGFAEVLKLAGGTDARVIATPAAIRETWGDYDHDAFPDAVAAIGQRYFLLDSVDGPDHRRTLQGDVSSSFGGMPTPSTTSVRSFDWADLDGDGALDLIAFGNSLRPHLSAGRINDTALFNVDCEPPVLNPGAATCDTTLATFAGAALPIGGGADMIAATAPTRGAYRIHPRNGGADITPLTLTGPVCGAVCAPILAVVIRDLDGDHLPDIVAIDASLGLFVGLTTVDARLSTLVYQSPISTNTTGFTAIRTSVSGAPR